jgi:hypothetical protein
MTEHVHAELRRSGGFAGRSVHVRVFAALPAGHGPMPPGADLVRYDLTLQRGRRHWQGTVYDPAPRQLQPLLQFLSTTRSTP